LLRCAEIQKDADRERAAVVTFDGDEAACVWKSGELPERRRVLGLVLDQMVCVVGVFSSARDAEAFAQAAGWPDFEVAPYRPLAATGAAALDPRASLP
jgi:hypothetical protein